MSEVVRDDIQELKKIMLGMQKGQDLMSENLTKMFDDKLEALSQSFKTQVEATVAPMRLQQEELLKKFAALEDRVSTMEREKNSADDGAMSDSSGVLIRAAKKPRAEPSALASSSGFRPSRLVSVGARARPSPASSSSSSDGEQFALVVTGFKRKVLRATMENLSKEVIRALPPSVREEASFWSFPAGTFFKVKFATKSAFLTALAYVKEHQIQLEFVDKVEEVARPLIVRKDKPIEQVKMGKFNSHFHSAVKALLKDTSHAEKRLRFFNGEMFVEHNDDIMALVTYSEISGTTKMEATPNYPNFLRLGFNGDAVDTMIASAMATANRAA